MVDFVMIDLKKKKYFLFDLDGTLVDLEQLNYKCFRETANKVSGKDLSFDEYMNYIAGVGSSRGLTSYFKSIEFPLSAEALIEMVKDYREQKEYNLNNNFNDVVTVKDGAGYFLRQLKTLGKKLAVTTSTAKKFAFLILEKSGLREYFDVIVTVDDVKNTKPDPETFLYALEKLSGSLDEAVIFEDSKNGVLSAKNAKVDYVVIRNKGKNDSVANAAEETIESYTELLSRLN